MRPMQAVVAAIRDGARSRADIRRATGLTDSTVDAVVHHLERTGHLTLEELGSSCAGGNCGSCIAAAANGSPGAPALLAGTGKDQVHLLLVCTGERGLSGAFNSAIVRLARERAQSLLAQGKDVKFFCVGRKGYEQLRRTFDSRIVEHLDLRSVRQIGFVHAEDIAKKVLARFEELDGYALDGRAREALSGLGFSQEMMDGDVGKLSGGWKMRVALARILLMRPDVMLLDEPSNHLDLESLIWLEQFLKGYEGALLMTSHDREFINRIINKVVEIDAGQLTADRTEIEALLK